MANHVIPYHARWLCAQCGVTFQQQDPRTVGVVKDTSAGLRGYEQAICPDCWAEHWADDERAYKASEVDG